MGGQYDAVENMPIGSRCIIMGGAGPPLMNAGYNANYQIVQAPGDVMILTEMIHDVRIIPLDGRPRRRQALRQWMGVSRGRWEGDTLVVETTNFNGKNPFRGASAEHEGDRALHAHRRRSDSNTSSPSRIRRRGRRPWTAELPIGEDRRPDLRVRVPRNRTTASPNILAARAPTRRRRPNRAKKGSN